MYCILSLMSFNLLPRAYLSQSIPPLIQGFLHLHPALPAYSNSNSNSSSNNNNNNNNFIRKEHGPCGLLPDLICQSIHHNCKQERDQSRSLMQSYNNLETLRRTYLAPLLCLATLVHVLYHFHILYHSRFPHTMPYVFSWHPVIRFLKIHKHAIKLRLPFSVFLLRS